MDLLTPSKIRGSKILQEAKVVRVWIEDRIGSPEFKSQKGRKVSTICVELDNGSSWELYDFFPDFRTFSEEELLSFIGKSPEEVGMACARGFFENCLSVVGKALTSQ